MILIEAVIKLQFYLNCDDKNGKNWRSAKYLIEAYKHVTENGSVVFDALLILIIKVLI
jgi:hypothetical protein